MVICYFRLFLNSSIANSPDNARVYRATIAPLDQPQAVSGSFTAASSELLINQLLIFFPTDFPSP
jgi:hypothetical protein